ncbi:unnamed protein product [Phytomonas sp. Hart1]|nr:unnamed protein product [Phytomonas sp. Hart1]|eukprot:CCW70477.1 unnamed protein product [Phytomonas sp. isolate Hart1]
MKLMIITDPFSLFYILLFFCPISNHAIRVTWEYTHDAHILNTFMHLLLYFCEFIGNFINISVDIFYQWKLYGQCGKHDYVKN